MVTIRNRRSPYRHRVRAHTRLGRPVKTFLRGKGKPRQLRKYRHIDGWVRKRVVARKPPVRPRVVKRPPKPRVVKKPPIIRKPPPVVPPVVVKTRRALLDRLEVHKRNLNNTRTAGAQARTFDTKVRYYKEYLGHAKLYNDTTAEINKLRGKKLRPMKALPLQEAQKKWTYYDKATRTWKGIKPGWVRGVLPRDPRAPKAVKIIQEYDSLWERMEGIQRQEERMTPAERRKSIYNRIDITKEAIEISDKYNELTGTPLTPYGRKLLVPEPVSGGLVLKQMFTKEQLSEYKKHKRELKKK